MQKIRKLGTNVSLVFWNIDNVHYRLDNQRYCKLTEPEVISHLTKHDIICLAETHSGPSDKIELDGYSLISNIRPKKPKATKYFGGLAVYIKNNIKQGITFMPITNSEYMWFKLDKHFFNLQADLYISLIYVCPASSTFANKRDDIFELIENDIANFSKMGNCLLCGDFNARTNKNPDFCTNDDISEQVDLPFHYVQDTEIPRQNIDNAKVDMQGKALLNLCKASGLRIVNGRFLGDRIGFYTCFNYKGAPSVIDYMICSQALLDHIQSFHVSDPNTASIHCSLSLHLRTNPFMKSEAITESPTFSPSNQYKWREGDNQKFPTALQFNASKQNISDFNQNNFNDNIDAAVSSLNNILYTAAKIAHILPKKIRTTKVKHNMKGKNKKWYDKDCHQMKADLKRLATEIRKNPFDINNVSKYRHHRKCYKQTLKKKRSLYIGQTLNNLETLQSSNPKEFWKIFQELKELDKPARENPINPEKWISHFSKLMNQAQNVDLAFEQTN